MQKNSNRMNRINEELKKEISKVLAFDLKDPNLTGMISVTKVDTSADLSISRVYVSMINAKSNKENLAILKKCSGFIRSKLAKKVNLRTTPELVFIFDDTLEYGSKIDSILKEITKDFKNENEEKEGSNED